MKKFWNIKELYKSLVEYAPYLFAQGLLILGIVLILLWKG